jgi:hypothetical protein
VNSVSISPELLCEVMKLHADMPAEDRQIYEVRMFRLFELLKEKGLTGTQHTDTAMALDFRLTALALLTQEHDVGAWVLPAAELGADFIHLDLIRAAAGEPVIYTDDGHFGFEPDRFRARVLTLTDPHGSA